MTGLSHGLFLVTGPTGSGKTTTLYTALSKLNAENLKIFTIEDPNRYFLAGINQIQVQPDVGLDFGACLWGILRAGFKRGDDWRNSRRGNCTERCARSTSRRMGLIHHPYKFRRFAIDRFTDLGVPAFLLAATLRGVLAPSDWYANFAPR